MVEFRRLVELVETTWSSSVGWSSLSRPP